MPRPRLIMRSPGRHCKGSVPSVGAVCCVVAAIALLAVPVLPQQQQLCSREGSRLARASIDRHLLPLLPSGMELLPACALHPSQDRYASQELRRVVGNNKGLLCGYCGKEFQTSRQLDHHFDARHPIPVPSRTSVGDGSGSEKGGSSGDSCLADNCDFLLCELEGQPRLVAALAALPCVDRHYDAVRRHCEATLQACVPAGPHRDRAVRQVCGRLTCENVAKEAGGSRGWLLDYLYWGGVTIVVIVVAVRHVPQIRLSEWKWASVSEPTGRTHDSIPPATRNLPPVAWQCRVGCQV